jgi:hypothetical protein
MHTPTQQPNHQSSKSQPAKSSPAPGQEQHFAPDAQLGERLRQDPRRLTPADVLHLQRTAGNQAVQRLLRGESARSAEAPQPAVQRDAVPVAAPPISPRQGEDALIQRLAYTDRPPQVAPGQVERVWKSGTGQTGVYFAQQGNERIVLKFTPVAEAQRSEFANEVIRTGTGLGAPQSRVYHSHNPADNTYQQVVPMLRAWIGRVPPPGNLLDQRVVDDTDATPGQPKAMTVMEAARGEGMDVMAANPGRHNALLSALISPQVIQGLAKMLVVDIILNNTDRILRPAGNAGERDPANVGNIFVNADVDDPRRSSVSTLDSDAQVNRFGPDAQPDLYLRDLAAIANDATVTMAVDRLIEGILRANNAEAPDPALVTSLNALRPGLVSGMIAAVKIERVQIVKQLKDKESKSHLKAAHARIAGELPGGSMPSYDKFRARAKMLQVKNKGKNDVKALAAAVKHLDHRNKQNRGELPRQKVEGAVSGAANKVKGLFTRNDEDD